MRKALLVSVLMLLAFCAFAADPTGVRTYFPSKATFSEILPYDEVLGQTCSATSSSEHQILLRMLQESYSFEWTQTHIRESERSAIVRLFGSWLSENLGSTDVLMSVSRRNEDGSFSISVRVNGHCMAFVLLDALVVSMKEL